MLPPTHQTITTLQQQIRCAGTTVRVLRTGTFGALLGCWASQMLAFATRRGLAGAWGWPEFLDAAWLALFLALLVACLCDCRRDADHLVWPCLFIGLGPGMPDWGGPAPLIMAGGLLATSLYWPLRRLRLRRALQALSPGERQIVLEPLARDPCRQTQNLAGPLLLEARGAARTEVVPAAAPEGRGSEPVPK
jgi:hypothetical protein